MLNLYYKNCDRSLERPLDESDDKNQRMHLSNICIWCIYIHFQMYPFIDLNVYMITG